MNQKESDSLQLKSQFTIGQCVPGEGGFMKLRVGGHLDANSAPRLAALLEEMLDQGHNKLELDFSAVRFISSTGIGTLIAATGEFKEAQGELVLRKVSAEIKNVFHTLDLFDYLCLR